MRSDTAMVFSALFALAIVAAMLALVGMVVYGVLTR